MKTLYFKTNRYVRREGNVIDFTEYRSRLQRAASTQAVGDSVSFHWETDDSVWHCDEAEEERRSPTVPAHGRVRRRYALADLLELCAAAGTLLLVVTVWIQFLL